MANKNSIQATYLIKKEYLKDKNTRSFLIKELSDKIGKILGEELVKRGLIEIDEFNGYSFNNNSLLVRAKLNVIGSELELKDNSFYKWCYEHKPEYIFDYLFSKDNKNEVFN